MFVQTLTVVGWSGLCSATLKRFHFPFSNSAFGYLIYGFLKLICLISYMECWIIGNSGKEQFLDYASCVPLFFLRFLYSDEKNKKITYSFAKFHCNFYWMYDRICCMSLTACSGTYDMLWSVISYGHAFYRFFDI